MTQDERIFELEQALDEAIKRYELALRFKGTFLCERQGDYEAVDRFRRILNSVARTATWHQESNKD